MFVSGIAAFKPLGPGLNNNFGQDREIKGRETATQCLLPAIGM